MHLGKRALFPGHVSPAATLFDCSNGGSPDHMQRNWYTACLQQQNERNCDVVAAVHHRQNRTTVSRRMWTNLSTCPICRQCVMKSNTHKHCSPVLQIRSYVSSGLRMIIRIIPTCPLQLRTSPCMSGWSFRPNHQTTAKSMRSRGGHEVRP